MIRKKKTRLHKTVAGHPNFVLKEGDKTFWEDTEVEIQKNRIEHIGNMCQRLYKTAECCFNFILCKNLTIISRNGMILLKDITWFIDPF